LTVGGYDDRGTADWSDDTMAPYSTWRNPGGETGAIREKPEVVAPATNIVGVGVNGALPTPTRSGTSYAAPQVAGLAALLIHRNINLRVWPEAMRAIIMATATHNVEKVRTGIVFDGSLDLKDGAGGINADLADITATTSGATPPSTSNACPGPCWWGEAVTTSSFPRNYYFNANAGDRIRIAAAWWAKADCPQPNTTNCAYDRLDMDLDFTLYYDPTNQIVSGAGSGDNNYSLMPVANEIILPRTGKYRINVTSNSMSEDNKLGVAWTKLPVSSPAVSSWGSGRLDAFVRHGDQVRVQAQFVSPDPSQGVADVETDPYHIVEVAKDGVWGGPIRFTLTDTDNHVLVEPVREVP
jgi:hypothetical protein